jgi:hypothetical protein
MFQTKAVKHIACPLHVFEIIKHSSHLRTCTENLVATQSERAMIVNAMHTLTTCLYLQ